MPWVTWFDPLFAPPDWEPLPATTTARREKLIDGYLEDTARTAATHEAFALQEARRGHRMPPVGHGLIEVHDSAGETALQLLGYQRRLRKLRVRGQYTGGTELLPV